MAEVEVEIEIAIEAPAPLVWAILTDLKGWKDWHPYTHFEGGEFGLGAEIMAVHTIEGKEHRNAQIITEIEDGVLFRWQGEIQEPAYAKGIHSFVVEAKGARSHFRESEKVTGALVETTKAQEEIVSSLNQGFTLSTQALKKFTEERQRKSN